MKKLSKHEILEWRKEFPILEEKIHLGNCSQSPQSLRVRAAIEEYLDNWRFIGMDWDSWVAKAIEAKVEFARLINAETSEIAISMSVSDATIAILSALPRDTKRNKVVASKLEFPTVGQILIAHPHLEHVFVPANDYIIETETYLDYVDQSTRLLCAAHVCYQNGFKQDIKRLSEIAHDAGAYFFVDAYQSLGTEPIDVKAMNIDFLASGNLKYLLGVPGIAFIYIKKEIADELAPNTTGWFGQKNIFGFKVDELDYADGTRRFDTGTPPVIAAYAAAAGLKIINEVGVDRINDRVNDLKTFLREKASELGIELYSPQDISKTGASTAIMVPDSHALEHTLALENVIISARGPVVRLAPHFFTLEEEIEKALILIKKHM